jgi:hypothetical protein
MLAGKWLTSCGPLSTKAIFFLVMGSMKGHTACIGKQEDRYPLGHSRR